MQGHNRRGKNYLRGMLAMAVVVLLLLAAGRTFGEVLPLAAILALALMAIGTMFMTGRGRARDRHRAYHHQSAPAGRGTAPVPVELPAPSTGARPLSRRAPARRERV